MAESRLENTKRNIMFGLAGKVIQLLFKFVLRTAIIYIFGAVYLGLDALFLNVLSVLCIAELGISNAICYALYKPFAESDRKKLRAYIALYRRIYRILGWVILLLGLCLMPCLKYIIHLNQAIRLDYRLAYMIFLLNTVLSYWFGAYAQVLFIADQKTWIVNNITNLCYVFTVILEIFAIVIFRNYYSYLAIMAAGNLSSNLALYMFAKRRYPALLNGTETLSRAEKLELKRNVAALALTKLSAVIYTSSDHIIISALAGTVVVGYYSNYSYVVSAVTGMISLVFNGALASVGNVNAAEKPEKKKVLFKRMLFLNHVIYGFCYVCMFVLFPDLIRVWAGEAYVFLPGVTLIICLLFLIPGLHHTCTIYKDACGLFWQTRYRTLATAGANLLLSLILGRRYGLSGILSATVFAYFLTTFLVDPKVIYRTIFKQSCKEFYRWYALSLVTSCAIGLAVRNMLCFITVRTWISLLVKTFLCAAVTAVLFLLTSCQTQESRYFWELINSEIKKRKK